MSGADAKPIPSIPSFSFTCVNKCAPWNRHSQIIAYIHSIAKQNTTNYTPILCKLHKYTKIKNYSINCFSGHTCSIFCGSPLFFFPFLMACCVRFCIVMNTKVIRVLGQFKVHLKVEQRQHVCTITMHSSIDAINAMQCFAMLCYAIYLTKPAYIPQCLSIKYWFASI